jgi:hypothetical protein
LHNRRFSRRRESRRGVPNRTPWRATAFPR